MSSYYTAIRHATPKNITAMYTPSREYQKAFRTASPKTIKEENTRVKYLSLHAVDKKAKELANFIARNRNIAHVKKSIKTYTNTLGVARAQNWSNTNMRLHAYYPYPRLTLRKVIYYLKQHLKRLEFAKFLTGRKIAEMMMTGAKSHFLTTQNLRRTQRAFPSITR